MPLADAEFDRTVDLGERDTALLSLTRCPPPPSRLHCVQRSLAHRSTCVTSLVHPRLERASDRLPDAVTRRRNGGEHEGGEGVVEHRLEVRRLEVLELLMAAAGQLACQGSGPKQNVLARLRRTCRSQSSWSPCSTSRERVGKLGECQSPRRCSGRRVERPAEPSSTRTVWLYQLLPVTRASTSQRTLSATPPPLF